MMNRLDPQPGPRGLFEAFIGLASRQLRDQNREHQTIKQWLKDLENYSHPQFEGNEKEAFSFPHRHPLNSRTLALGLPSTERPSDRFPGASKPPQCPVTTQLDFPEAYVNAQLSASTSATTGSTQTNPSPSVMTSTNRQKELQNMSLYTSLLKAYGTKNGILVKYDERQEMPAYPPKFHCKITVGAFTAEGRGSSKKEAQHRASKALQNDLPEPFESLRG